MKKTLALAIITLATLATTTQAQSLTFDETVKYINKKDNEISTGEGSMTAKKNGMLSYFTKDGYKYAEINLFDIELVHEYDADFWKNYRFIYRCKYGQDCIKRFDEEDGNRFNDEMTENIQNTAEAKKLIKAYNYLRTLCKKEVDPFN